MKDFSTKTAGFYTVKYIYKIKEKEDFIMNPNMRNFEKLEKGQNIARNQDGPIKAPINGHLLMPLYQKQGKEGFYIITK